MDEKLSKDNGQMLPTHQEQEEEMDVTVRTKLENLIVTPVNVALPSNTQKYPEEKGAFHEDSTAATLSINTVCKTGDYDDNNSEDSDRYLHTHTQQFDIRLVINFFTPSMLYTNILHQSSTGSRKDTND